MDWNILAETFQELSMLFSSVSIVGLLGRDNKCCVACCCCMLCAFDVPIQKMKPILPYVFVGPDWNHWRTSNCSLAYFQSYMLLGDGQEILLIDRPTHCDFDAKAMYTIWLFCYFFFLTFFIMLYLILRPRVQLSRIKIFVIKKSSNAIEFQGSTPKWTMTTV